MGFIADIFTADKAADAQKDASRDAAKASQYSTDKTLGLQKEIFDRIWGGTQVQRDAGDAATRMMAQLMGLSLPASQAPQGQPQPQTQPSLTRNALTGTSDLALNPLTYGENALSDGSAYNPNNALTPMPQPQQSGAAAGAAQPFDATAWLRSTPGYQFNFDEGARALNASLASRGKLFSGDAGREAVRYGQNYGDRIYGDQFNRLGVIAGAGQTAQSQGASAGTNYANASGNALMQNAQNLGSSYANRGNAISGFWGSVSGSLNNAQNGAARMFMGGF